MLERIVDCRWERKVGMPYASDGLRRVSCRPNQFQRLRPRGVQTLSPVISPIRALKSPQIMVLCMAGIAARVSVQFVIDTELGRYVQARFRLPIFARRRYGDGDGIILTV
jgi:hypothetical protein